jgi:hypothetical protein
MLLIKKLSAQDGIALAANFMVMRDGHMALPARLPPSPAV